MFLKRLVSNSLAAFIVQRKENVSMKKVFVVNGYPRSGKDTFAEILSKYVKVMKISSVDKVKEIARLAGWNGEKDDKGRKLLADLKAVLVDYDDLPFKYVYVRYQEFLSSDYDVLLVDIREQTEIVKAKKELGAETVFIENKNINNIVSNSSDANIPVEGYDYVVRNNCSLEEYEVNIKKFIKEVLGI